MASQLRRYSQASQAVHGADDVSTLHSGQILLGFCGPQVDIPTYYSWLGAQPSSHLEMV